MASSVSFMGYGIKSDPPSIEHRKTNGFFQSEIKLLTDLGLLNISTGVTTPVVPLAEIGEFLNWIATGKKGEIPPSAKRILCTRLQTLKNPNNSSGTATQKGATGLVPQIEALIGDCSKVAVLPNTTQATLAKPASSGLSLADLQTALKPLKTELMAHIDAKFAAHKSETEALKQLLTTEIAKIHGDEGLGKLEKAFDAKISELGTKVEALEKTMSKTDSNSIQPVSRSTSSSSLPASSGVQTGLEAAGLGTSRSLIPTNPIRKNLTLNNARMASATRPKGRGWFSRPTRKNNKRQRK